MSIESLKEIKEYVNEFKQKLQKSSFIKAIGGKRYASMLEKILSFTESIVQDLEAGKILVSKSDIENILTRYYVTEREVKNIVKTLLSVMTGKYLDVVKDIIPLLPENIKRIIANYVTKVASGASEEAIKDLDKEIEYIFQNLLSSIKKIYEGK